MVAYVGFYASSEAMQFNDWSSAPAAPTRHIGRSHALLHAAECML